MLLLFETTGGTSSFQTKKSFRPSNSCSSFLSGRISEGIVWRELHSCIIRRIWLFLLEDGAKNLIQLNGDKLINAMSCCDDRYAIIEFYAAFSFCFLLPVTNSHRLFALQLRGIRDPKNYYKQLSRICVRLNPVPVLQ